MPDYRFPVPVRSPHVVPPEHRHPPLQERAQPPPDDLCSTSKSSDGPHHVDDHVSLPAPEEHPGKSGGHPPRIGGGSRSRPQTSGSDESRTRRSTVAPRLAFRREPDGRSSRRVGPRPSASRRPSRDDVADLGRRSGRRLGQNDVALLPTRRPLPPDVERRRSRRIRVRRRPVT